RRYVQYLCWRVQFRRFARQRSDEIDPPLRHRGHSSTARFRALLSLHGRLITDRGETMAQGKRKRAKKAVAKKAVAKKRAPRPVYTSTRKSMVPLSDAVTVGSLIFVSGTTPFDGEGRIARGDFAAQMHQVMANIKAILAAAGSSLERVAKVVVILTRLEDF